MWRSNPCDFVLRAIQAALAKQHAEMEAYASQIEEEQQEKERLEAQLREIESKVGPGGVLGQSDSEMTSFGSLVRAVRMLHRQRVVPA